jgi:TPR repeat protein
MVVAAALGWLLLVGSGEPVPGPVPDGLKTAEPASVLHGAARARALLDSSPSAAAVLAAAEDAADDGDCDAATLLYLHAAKRVATAATVARRYDSEGFEPSPCIDAPAEDRALNAYRVAADAGDASAQRRLGELLLAAYAAGPIHEEGLDWLRQAAAGGDAAAASRLRELQPQ